MIKRKINKLFILKETNKFKLHDILFELVLNFLANCFENQFINSIIINLMHILAIIISQWYIYSENPTDIFED